MRIGDVAGSVIGLGTFCLTDQIIKYAFGDHARYPFDDIFASAKVISDCLENDFKIFLDFSNLQMADNDLTWVQKSYIERFGEVRTIAHYDMRLTSNQAKFVRRVDRFRELYGKAGLHFVYMGYSNRIDQRDLDGLYDAWRSRFAGSDLLIILIGKPDSWQEFVKHQRDDLAIVGFDPISHIDGTQFVDGRDNYALIDIVNARASIV